MSGQNGKGMAPRKGYNHKKYAENYDGIFRVKAVEKTSMINARLTKLSTRPEGTVDPEGSPTGPIGDGYTVLGAYDKPPTVGQPFAMWRYERNGVKVFGQFTTSPVTKVYDGGFETENSVYKLEQESKTRAVSELSEQGP